MFDREALITRLIQVESMRLFPYQDTAGKTTIGVGRNLSDTGISRDEALLLLNNDIDQAWQELVTRVPVCARLDSVRQAVFVELAFNLGVDGLLGFSKMLAAVTARDFPTAAKELLDSQAARQTGTRYQALADMLLTGQRKQVD